MRFYCLDHPQEIRVRAVETGRVWCDEGRHYLAQHFPSKPYWGHCYECKAVWFHKPEMLPREDCPACKRRLELSHLCHNCETFGYGRPEVDAVITPPDGDEISCGACAADLGGARWHFCLTLGRPFRTGRDKCPLCVAGFFPVTAAELPAAANGNQYQPACLAGPNDDRATLVAPAGRGRRDVLFALLAGPHGAAIVLPRDATRERVVQKARVFRQVFDWPSEWAGDLIVERPAIFELDEDKWRLKEFGVLAGRVVDDGAAAEPPAPDQSAHTAEVSVEEATGDLGEHPVERAQGSEIAQAKGRAEPTAPPDLRGGQFTPPQQTNAPEGVGAEQPSATRMTDPAPRRVAGGEYDRAAGADGGPTEMTPRGRTSSTSSPGAAGRALQAEGGLSHPARENFVSPSSFKLAHAAVAASLLLVLTFIVWHWWSRPGTAPPPPPPTPEATATPTPDRPSPPPVEGMVFIPGGPFRMGRDDGDNYEGPAHGVTVEPFYIDQFEVTCEDYQRFVEEKKHAAPPGWLNGKYPAGSGRMPVTGVSWGDADAYARWAGKRLPTEKEWEFAARGADGRLYPWGHEWKPQGANAKGSGPGRPTEVGLYREGASPFGALDMAGNVWEWTADSIRSYEGGSIPEDSLPAGERNKQKVLRGGCYLSSAQQATATYRRGWPERGADYAQTGFRCAKDAGAQTPQD